MWAVKGARNRTGTSTGTPELGGQEGQLPPLPFAGRGKGGKGAL